ncbi:MAG: hypoxanthine-guanine phosphoribosyltransferase [Burkholderiales bacterium]
MLTPGEARLLLEDSELLCTQAAVEAAVDRIATELAARLSEAMPLLLVVMRGATVFFGQLLPRLGFPLEVDYIHATRYGDTTAGSQVEWRVRPRESVRGRVVVVVDDVLDEGHTLAAVRQALLEEGAAEVLIAVFCEKDLGRPKPIAADFTGLRLPNRYVFGYGMDVNGAWRNLPAVYALKEHGNS